MGARRGGRPQARPPASQARGAAARGARGGARSRRRLGAPAARPRAPQEAARARAPAPAAAAGLEPPPPRHHEPRSRARESRARGGGAGGPAPREAGAGGGRRGAGSEGGEEGGRDGPRWACGVGGGEPVGWVSVGRGGPVGWARTGSGGPVAWARASLWGGLWRRGAGGGRPSAGSGSGCLGSWRRGRAPGRGEGPQGREPAEGQPVLGDQPPGLWGRGVPGSAARGRGAAWRGQRGGGGHAGQDCASAWRRAAVRVHGTGRRPPLASTALGPRGTRVPTCRAPTQRAAGRDRASRGGGGARAPAANPWGATRRGGAAWAGQCRKGRRRSSRVFLANQQGATRRGGARWAGQCHKGRRRSSRPFLANQRGRDAEGRGRVGETAPQGAEEELARALGQSAGRDAAGRGRVGGLARGAPRLRPPSCARTPGLADTLRAPPGPGGEPQWEAGVDSGPGPRGSGLCAQVAWRAAPVSSGRPRAPHQGPACQTLPVRGGRRRGRPLLPGGCAPQLASRPGSCVGGGAVRVLQRFCPPCWGCGGARCAGYRAAEWPRRTLHPPPSSAPWGHLPKPPTLTCCHFALPVPSTRRPRGDNRNCHMHVA
ncbi:spidroin-1 [Oryctolagus cuniculus]|uniref:spidroin-1 n=1 Tax=Oryctolagus cuniculus TaxID=9986 RepID=UPI00387A01A3